MIGANTAIEVRLSVHQAAQLARQFSTKWSFWPLIRRRGLRMFRDEGTEPVREFRQRMDRRVMRTPTSIVIAVLPVLIVARLSLVAHSYYTRTRCRALARRINSSTDLRSARWPTTPSAQGDALVHASSH